MVLLIEDKPGGQDGVRLITLNRPERKNALSPELLDALRDALGDAENDPQVRAIVLTGAPGPEGPMTRGAAFCAGGDLGSGPAGDGFFQQHKDRGAFAELLIEMRHMSTPTVAAVNGTALGGGFGLVLACDLAVVADDAELGTPEIKRGLFPMMIAALIDEQLPRKFATELMLMGGKVDGKRAVELGIANKAVPRADVVSEALTYAIALSDKSAAVLALGKRAVALQRDMPFDEKLYFLRDQLTLNLHLDDAAEGIAAFLEKRPAQWKHR